MTFGKHLKYRRELCEYSQLELSKRSGISTAAICYYEKDERLPDLKSFKKLIEAMPWKAETYLKYLDKEEAEKEVDGDEKG